MEGASVKAAPVAAVAAVAAAQTVRRATTVQPATVAAAPVRATAVVAAAPVQALAAVHAAAAVAPHLRADPQQQTHRTEPVAAGRVCAIPGAAATSTAMVVGEEGMDVDDFSSNAQR